MKSSHQDFTGLVLEKSSLQKWNPLFWVKKIYFSARLIYGCLKVIQNPFNTDLVIKSAQHIATTERLRESQDYLRSTPEGEAIFRERPRVPRFDLYELQKLPEGSLGKVYANHMIENGLDPDFFDVDFSDDITYAFYRYGKVHDLWHVAGGFDTSIKGEIGILSFSVAQTRGPGLTMIIALAFLHGVFFKPNEVYGYFEAAMEGWTRGVRAKNLHAVNWATEFHKPLEQFRQEHNLVVPD